MIQKDVFAYILEEERNFKLNPVTIFEGYDWNMFDHIKKIVLYKNSTYFKEQNRDQNKPFFNIIIPILNLQYRATGFDVKDIEIFVTEAKNYYKSFIVRKFHDRWATEQEMDTFIDELVESYVDFGAGLIKDNKEKPEIVPLQRLAFCDQTNLLGGALCEKHFFLPNELEEMKSKGWENVDELIEMATQQHGSHESGDRGFDVAKKDTPSKYIEVYELHGVLPSSYLDDEYEGEDTEYERQVHIVAFYKTKDNKKQGITLFSGKESKQIYDALIRDPIYGRALGRSAVEELFDPQVWVNYSALRMKAMLDAASKAVYQTADPTFHAKNNLERIENNEILVHAPNAPLSQINTFNPNIQLFERALNMWMNQGQVIASATGPLLGEEPKSGTPFKLQELVTAEGHSIHEYRKGKVAVFLEKVYRKLVLPRFAKEIGKDQEFISDLDWDELGELVERVVENQAHEAMTELVLSGKTFAPEEVAIFKEQVRNQMAKGGNRVFFQIFKGEMKDIPLDVKLNIVGKQKYLPQIVDKLVNVFRQIVAAPQILQNPGMAKLFNEILEGSGLSPIGFSDLTKMQPQLQQPAQPAPAQLPQ